MYQFEKEIRGVKFIIQVDHFSPGEPDQCQGPADSWVEGMPPEMSYTLTVSGIMDPDLLDSRVADLIEEAIEQEMQSIPE